VDFAPLIKGDPPQRLVGGRLSGHIAASDPLGDITVDHRQVVRHA
jgi:hypothetical protein